MSDKHRIGGAGAPASIPRPKKEKPQNLAGRKRSHQEVAESDVEIVEDANMKKVSLSQRLR